jgi:hypothetical protein
MGLSTKMSQIVHYETIRTLGTCIGNGLHEHWERPSRAKSREYEVIYLVENKKMHVKTENLTVLEMTIGYYMFHGRKPVTKQRHATHAVYIHYTKTPNQ